MEIVPEKKGKRNLLIRSRPVLRWVIKLRSSPRAIAGGLGIGTFIAFTPTVGVQVILALIIATAFNINRPATIVPLWITNPITVAPIYTFNYWIGTFFWDGPPLSDVSKLFITIGRTMASLDFWDIKEQFLAVLQMGREILIPLLLGSVAIGLVTGLLTYFLSLKVLSVFLVRRSHRHLLNNRKQR